jgi:hypothetical protein
MVDAFIEANTAEMTICFDHTSDFSPVEILSSRIIVEDALEERQDDLEQGLNEAILRRGLREQAAAAIFSDGDDEVHLLRIPRTVDEAAEFIDAFRGESDDMTGFYYLPLAGSGVSGLEVKNLLVKVLRRRGILDSYELDASEKGVELSYHITNAQWARDEDSNIYEGVLTYFTRGISDEEMLFEFDDLDRYFYFNTREATPERWAAAIAKRNLEAEVSVSHEKDGIRLRRLS